MHSGACRITVVVLATLLVLVMGGVVSTVPLLVGCADVPQRPAAGASTVLASDEEVELVDSVRPGPGAGPELQLRRIDTKFQRVIEATEKQSQRQRSHRRYHEQH